MQEITTEKNKEDLIKKLFELGAHFGFSRRRRHPSADKFVYGYKNNNAIIDLNESAEALSKAQAFVEELGRDRKVLLFVGSKPEAKSAVIKAAGSLDMPYVTERWIGGTFTNFKQIKKRVERLKWLREAEETGELGKYKKKERLMFAKERKDLERYFEGIVDMVKLPDAIFIVDVLEEDIAAAEAKQCKIPIITVSNSDCDIRGIDYPVVANDTSLKPIAFFVESITDSYKKGLKSAPAQEEKKEVGGMIKKVA